MVLGTTFEDDRDAGQQTAGGDEQPSVSARAKVDSRRGQARDIQRATVGEPIVSRPGVAEQPLDEIGLVAHDGAPPLRLRASPSTEEDNLVGELPFNTRLQVNASVAGGWFRVSLPDGRSGYVASVYVRTNLPEPNAELHRVEGGTRGTAIAIAEQHFGAEADDWGQDLRFYVAVLARLNGVSIPDTAAGWKQVHFQAGRFIWIPSPAFARTLVGTVNSGSYTYEAASAMGVEGAIERVGQAIEDVKAALTKAVDYLGEAVARHVEESAVNILLSLAIALIGSVALVSLCSAIGALLGLGAGGAGAGPGAAAGAKFGLVVLEWLGLGFLVAWILKSGYDIASGFGGFILTVLGAEGDPQVIDQAAHEFAEATGRLLGVLLEALALWAASVGIARVTAVLKGTRLGEAIGEAKLSDLLRGKNPPNGKPPGNKPPGGQAQGGQKTVQAGQQKALEKLADVKPKISQKQNRHIKDRKEWVERGEGSYFESFKDAQIVLDAAHNGTATVLGLSKQGHIVVEFTGVVGYNMNPAAGYLNQPTHVFIIKGTASPSVVPTSPTWSP